MKPADTKKSGGFTGAAANYLDERTSISTAVKELGRKIFPDHWSFLLGEVALYSFVIILLSGSFLTFFFQASMAEVHYDGSYVPLKGVEMSVAMASSLDISFDVRGGLLMRRCTTGRRSCSWPPSGCTCSASTSPAHSASRASSTG